MLKGGGTRRACISFECVGVLEGGAVHFAEGVTIIDDGVSRRTHGQRVCCVCS